MLLSANLIYAINYSVAKDVMPDFIRPFGFIFLRVSVATVCFWILGLGVKEKVEKKDFKLLFWGGVTGVAINQLFFFAGLNLTSPINASVLMIFTPVLVLIFSALLSKTPISARKLTGIILGFVGAGGLILNSSKSTLSVSNPWGDLMIFLNAASYAVFLVITRPLMIKYHPLTVVKWVFLFGLIPVSIAGWREFGMIQWHSMPSIILAETVFVVLGTTVLAYFLNLTALRYVSSSVVAVYIYSQPLLAGWIAVTMGKDFLTLSKIILGLIVITGVVLATGSFNKSTD
jgi:drug/metabolite transporter (DMT)-like permease